MWKRNFVLGIAMLAVFFLGMLAKGKSDEAKYSISGSYSVNRSTHIEQMSGCAQDIAMYRARIHDDRLERDDTAVLDEADLALLRANVCAAWASEPLDKPSRDVIEASTKLNFDIAANFRYSRKGNGK